MRTRLGAALSLCVCAAALAEPALEVTGAWRGTLGGKLAIGVWLESEGDAVRGYYFYLKRGEQIALTGKLGADGSLSLEEKADGKVTGLWTAKVAGERISGTWRAPGKKKTLELRLTQLAGGPEALQALKGADYQFHWVNSKTNPGVALPLLTGYRSTRVEQKVDNQLLQKLDGLKCDEPGGTFNTKAEVKLAAKDILSIQIRSSYDCGGAHPGETDDSVTYDLRTGDQFAFAGLFESYAAQKEAILRAIYQEKIDDAPDEGRSEECPAKWPLAEIADWDLRYYLTPEGLVVYPEFPHVMRACSFETKVPVGKLQAFHPGEILQRLK